jgi:heme-degrading monooxygenase HmoA
VLVISRFRVSDAGADAFRDDLEQVHALLGSRPGYVAGRIGRNVDDPELWVLTVEWENVGAYRRALSAYEVKVGAVALLSTALDEPSAYEVVEPGADLNISATRSLR